MATLTGEAYYVYEAILNTARMHITVDQAGVVIHAYSPDKPCFSPNFVGEFWASVKARLQAQGFLVHTGN